ncbi:hypothetical protein AB0K15_23060 [Amycolatopsis sp. NPDC049253]|uniref:hypothetical protein n=1 Tax=Amycolatopsis sp. NPDC049253 TaxID=3155274 RepID=UPI00344A9B9F
MSSRMADGSAGDADYGEIGKVYTGYRNPDPRIAAPVDAALGDAKTVLNVGAGAGSYEPADRLVTAVEPSASMRTLRHEVRPTAEDLPFPGNSFAAAMATFVLLPAASRRLNRPSRSGWQRAAVGRRDPHVAGQRPRGASPRPPKGGVPIPFYRPPPTKRA